MEPLQTERHRRIDVGEIANGQRLRAGDRRHLGNDRRRNGKNEVEVDAVDQIAPKARHQHQRQRSSSGSWKSKLFRPEREHFRNKPSTGPVKNGSLRP